MATTEKQPKSNCDLHHYFVDHDFLKGVKPEDQDKVRKDMYPYFNPEQKKYVRKYDKFVPSSGM
jgi:hypothetical protein